MTDQPSTLGVLWRSVVHKVRATSIAVALLLLVKPYYLSFAREWTYHPSLFFMLSSLLVHETLYWGMNGFFYLCDRNQWLQEYKLPRKPAQQAPDELRNRTVREAAMGHFFVQPVLLVLAYYVFKACGSPDIDADVPDYKTLFVQLVICDTFNEWGFYWSHRLLHTPALYRFHKQHHKWVGTEGFAAEFASPLETIVSNQLPTIGGAMFFGVHPLVWLIWLAWRIENTYETHSGYSFDFTLARLTGLGHAHASAYHDYHHGAGFHSGSIHCNYGSELLDFMFGTSGNWYSYEAKLKADRSKSKAL